MWNNRDGFNFQQTNKQNKQSISSEMEPSTFSNFRPKFLRLKRYFREKMFCQRSIFNTITPDLPEWEPFCFVYLKSNAFWFIIKQSLNLRSRICLSYTFHSKSICRQKKVCLMGQKSQLSRISLSFKLFLEYRQNR